MNKQQAVGAGTKTTDKLIDDIPEHVAVIMDGNGRWAKLRGKPRIAGHRKGVDSVREMVRGCAAHGVKYLTLFAFSSENWRRPATEVRLLMELLTSALESEVRRLHKNNVRLRVLGDLTPFSDRINGLIVDAEGLTKTNTRLNLNIAVNYGGQWDITNACRQIAEKVKAGDIESANIDQALIEQHLTTTNMPEPDLFIRTGGEQRISNFLLWQLAYCELYFTNTLWPDFDREAFKDAIYSFQRRQRRFGQTGDQVTTLKQVRNA